MKTSKELWSELHQGIKSLISFNTPESSVGKTVKTVYNAHIRYTSVVLVQFTDGSVLYHNSKYYDTCPLAISTYYNDSSNKAEAFIGEAMSMFIELGLVSEEQVMPLLELGKQYEQTRHQETIREEIQKRLDEISKLKDEL